MNYKFRKLLYEDAATNNSFEERVAYAKQQLQNGADPKDVFDFVSLFHDRFTLVRLKGKYNYIDRNGNFLRDDLWFDSANHFFDGFARVKLDDKWYFIDENGNFLRDDLWFEKIRDFSSGLAAVKLKDRGWNFIYKNGNFLRDDLWFDDAEPFYGDFAEVKLKGKNYKIDTKGNLYDEKGNPIDKVNENRRRTIRLTESQLRNTIKNVVAQCLKEGRRR